MSGTRGTRGVLLVTAGLIGSLLYVGSAGGVARFGDVEADRFYTRAVQWMVDNDITTGTSPTCFSPEDFVTRGQAAAFMWRMMGFPPPGPRHPFVDVVKDWQQDPVSWMSNNDITTGTTPSTFSPEDILTRGQLAALLYRLEGNPPPGPPHPFGDVVKDWQQDAVSWMSNNDITTGTTPTTFSPDDFVTRGQLAAFFYRYMGSPPVVVDPFTPPCPDDGSGGTTTTTTMGGGGTTSTTTTMGGGGTTSTTTSTTTTTTTTTTTIPGGGGNIFNNNCAGCHGADGNSGGAPNLSPTSLSLQQIITQINTGGAPGGMPAFSGVLSDDQINTVARYVFNDEFP